MSISKNIKAHVADAVGGIVKEQAAKQKGFEACQAGVDRLFDLSPALMEKAIEKMGDVDGLHIVLGDGKNASRARLIVEDGRPVITLRFHPDHDVRDTYHTVGKAAADREAEENRVGEDRGRLFEVGIDLDKTGEATIEKLGVALADQIIKAARGVEGAHQIDWSGALD